MTGIVLLTGICIWLVGKGTEYFMVFFGGIIGCVSLIAFSELLNLFVDIEGNTRRTANLLDKGEMKEETIQPFSGSIRSEYAERVVVVQESNQ